MAKKLGTGTVANSAGSRKWAEGVKSQIAGATQHKGLNARYLPMSQITLDPTNPRRLSINPDRVRELIANHPIDPDWLAVETKETWLDDYLTDIATELGGKALTDFQETLLLAISIKSHDRLINPVTVYAEESGTDIRLIAGERRYLAHTILGEEMIAARILPYRPDDLDKDLLQWEENNQRLELTLHEQLINLERLVSGWESRRNKRLSVSDMVVLAGLPRVTAHRYLTVIRCPHTMLKEAIADGQVNSLKQAAHLATLSVEELETALNPVKQPSKSKPIFKIARRSDYSPVKAVLKAAAAQLGGKNFMKLLDAQDLDTAEGIADAFDKLVHLVAEQQSGQH